MRAHAHTLVAAAYPVQSIFAVAWQRGRFGNVRLWKDKTNNRHQDHRHHNWANYAVVFAHIKVACLTTKLPQKFFTLFNKNAGYFLKMCRLLTQSAAANCG